jgi:glutamine amidotransferase
MKSEVGLIDYGAGNLRSVYKALVFLGANVRIITSPDEINGVRSLILPGVGAFGDCSIALRNQELTAGIRDFIKSGKPFFGICVGYQILFRKSEEFASNEPGLGVFEGQVRRFQPQPGLKIPQIGWNQVKQKLPECPLFRNIPDESWFYFVHSFHPVPDDSSIIAGTTDYGGEFASAVWKDNVMATQFHPEKSQKMGLQLLENFLALE